MFIFWLALRYIYRRPILRIAVAGVALGMGSLIVVDSILKGFSRELASVFRGMTSDIRITPPPDEYLPAGARDFTKFRQTLLAQEGVVGAARRLTRPCLLGTDKEIPRNVGLGQLSRGPVIQVYGIVPEEEYGVSQLRDFLANSQDSVADLDDPFAAGRGPGGIPILLGRKLAEVLEVVPGDLIDLLAFPDDVDLGREMKALVARFRVAGTFRTGYFSEDLRTAFIPLHEMQRFVQLPASMHEVAVKAEPGVDLIALRDRLRDRLRFLIRRREAVQTWDADQHLASLLAALENQRNILGAIVFVIVFVAGFSLLVTLSMMIAEKRRDISVLCSMGAAPGEVAWVFTSCGVLATLLGLAAGTGLAVVVTDNINLVHDLLSGVLGGPIFREDVYWFQSIPVQLDPQRIALFWLATIVFTTGFTILASWRVSRLEPVDSLRLD